MENRSSVFQNDYQLEYFKMVDQICSCKGEKELVKLVLGTMHVWLEVRGQVSETRLH